VGYFYDYIGLLTTFFIPVYALTGYLVFIDSRKYNFSEHLVFCIYVFGLLNIFTFLLTPLVIGFEIDYQVISLIITPLSIIQFAWYYKRCFQLDTGQIVLKTFIALIIFQIISVIYLVFFVVIIIGLIFLIQPELLTSITIE
jgi:IS4 transposase